MYAYVVKGSEDGNLGVYSSMKKALISAKEYVANADDLDVNATDFDIGYFCDGYLINVACEHSWVTADIEKFKIN